MSDADFMTVEARYTQPSAPRIHLAPRFSTDQAASLSRDLYGITALARPLPSERDQNFHLQTASGERFVLKIANPLEHLAALEAQNAAMEHIAHAAPSIGCPRVCPTTSGDDITSVEDPDGRAHLVRMLTYLPGIPFASVKSHSPRLLSSLGRFFGKLDSALESFSHPGARRDLQWDMKHSGSIVSEYLPKIAEPDRRTIVERVFLQFEADVLPALPNLRTSVIHNDGNDYNVLVAPDGPDKDAVVGIVDFGDMVETHTVFEVAVAAAYALLGKKDPLAAAAHVINGYHEAHPLTEFEPQLLNQLISMRLCASVAIAAHQKKENPTNEYLVISERPAWAALERLARVNQTAARARFLTACKRSVDSAGSSKMNRDEILAARRRHIGRSLGTLYDEPLHVVRGSRQYLYDETGRAFLDAVNNVCHVGHCHPAVVEAAQKQIAVLNTNTRYLHENIVRYAERLTSTMPDPLSVCFFVCSGSEANDLALRLARTQTNHTDVIVIEGAYHGNTVSLIEISPYKFDSPGGSGAPHHVHKVAMPDTYRGPYKDPEDAAQLYANHIGDVLQEVQAAGRQVAAFFCESILGCGGQIVLPKNYLKQAYAQVRNAGGVCVADEVQVGFGRVGSHCWGFETQDVVPDIVTLGKPMGNGHPLAAVVTTPKIAESFDNGMEYFNTFGGNPVSCAIGLAVLDVIESERLKENALEVGGCLKDDLKGLMNKHQLIGDVRGEGLFLGLELVLDRKTLAPAVEEAAQVAERMKERGVLIGTEGPRRNVLKIKPPMVFNRSNAGFLVDVLDRVLTEVETRAGA